MSQPAKVLLTVLIGGGLGGVLAFSLKDRDPTSADPGVFSPAEPVRIPPAVQERAEPGDPRSYYLRELRRRIAIDAMTPTLVTPRAREHVAPECPERLAVVTSNDAYHERVRPWLDAVGIFTPAAKSGLAAEACERIESAWETLRAIATGPVGTPPLRVMAKHYPRPELPGQCHSLTVTFYTVPDFYFDPEGSGTPDDGGGAPRVPGVLVVLHRTYQLEGDRPRLVDAIAEAHVHVRFLQPHRGLWQVLGPRTAGAFAENGSFGAHFEAYGGGERHGLAWVDRAAGRGAPDPWTGAYRMTATQPGQDPAVKTEAIDGALAAELRAFVARA